MAYSNAQKQQRWRERRQERVERVKRTLASIKYHAARDNKKRVIELVETLQEEMDKI